MFKIGDQVRWRPDGRTGIIIGPCASFNKFWNVRGVGNSCHEDNLAVIGHDDRLFQKFEVDIGKEIYVCEVVEIKEK